MRGVVSPALAALLEVYNSNTKALPGNFFASIPQGSSDWHYLRKNVLKVTGSEFASVLGIDPYTSKKKLHENKVLYYNTGELPTKSLFQTKIMDWGVQNEEKAYHLFQQYITEKYDALYQVKTTGTWIFTDDYRLGSTPDGLIGTKEGPSPCAVVEIKCPFRQSPYTELLNVSPYIKETHYIQMLMEMRAVDVADGYYVCWTPDQTLVAKVAYNKEYADRVFDKVSAYARDYLQGAKTDGSWDDSIKPTTKGLLMKRGEKEILKTEARDVQDILYIDSVVVRQDGEIDVETLYKKRVTKFNKQ